MSDRNPSHLIKINLAPATEIALLYGIGDKLSERIVAHREKHGAFYSPSDLANVSGVSLQLAETLSAQIDWKIADEDVKDISERSYFYSVLLLAMAFFSLLNTYYMQIVQIKEALAEGGTSENIWLWIHINFTLCKVAGAFMFVCLAVYGCTVSVRYKKRFLKLSVYFFLTSLLFMLFVATGNVVFYQFYASEGWYELLDSPSNLLAGLIGVAAFVISTIIFVSWYLKHSARTMTIMRFICDFVVITATALALLWAYKYTSELVKPTLPLIIAQLGLASFNIWQGFGNIFSQFSPLDSAVLILNEAFSKARSQDAIATIRWMKWLNKHVPSVEEQRELQRTLNETYPPSRTKTLFGLLTIGLGGWLAVVAVEAIIQWFVQGWLEKFLK